MAERKCGIGVDFGTTNSSVALFDGKTAISVTFPLDDEATVPSALYLSRQNRAPIVGRDAIRTYLRDNTQRLVTLTQESLGEIELFAADATFTFKIHGLSDRDLPGRLFLSLKRWLGDKGTDEMAVFGRPRRLVELVSDILSHLAVGLGVVEDEPVHFGRPVHFHGDSALATKRLAESAGQAGFRDVRFYPEPVAAITSFLHKNPHRPGDIYLCFDFGGGTLDLCVVRAFADFFEIMGTHGIPLGGDTIDQLIFRRRVFPELGDGCPLSMLCPDGSRTLYRFNLLRYEDELLNWQLAYRLNQPRLISPIVRNIGLPGEEGEKFRRLHATIRHNLAYRITRAIEEAKIRLSDAQETRIEVPEINLNATLTRAEFESYLSGVLSDIEECVLTVLEKAGRRPDELRAVVCTGGSSQIPAVKAHLRRILGRPIVEHDVFVGVATGLAVANYRNYASPLD